MEACREYATHLYKSGQGITNPGGYATTIYRSGEADEMMRDFFKAERVDISQCPDCNGQGINITKYMESDGQITEKCKHENLKHGGTDIG
jgi:hypothetical protein